jgi:hypothetical protein
MDRIGPKFVHDLQAAMISLEGIAWGADGALTFRDDVPQDVQDRVRLVLAAHDPAAPAPDIALADGLARPEIQAILGLIAQQQGTTVDAIQTQAITAHTAEVAAKAQLPTGGATASDGRV